MSRRSLTPVVLLAAAASCATGCGGSSSTLSRADFVKQANAICKGVNDRIAKAGQAKTAADVQRIGPIIITAEHDGLTSLSKLHPPAALASDWKRLQSDLSQLTANAAKIVSASARKDATTTQSVASASQQIQSEITAIATRDALTECAKG